MEYTVLFLGICATVVSSQMFGLTMPSALPRRCQKQPDWNCEFGSPNIYYNSRSQTCEWSIFKCGSTNMNTFLNKKACMKACGCHATPDYGECPRGKNVTETERYYYNGMFKFCMPFVYSGCEGNKNNFQSFFECQHTCGSFGVFEF